MCPAKAIPDVTETSEILPKGLLLLETEGVFLVSEGVIPQIRPSLYLVG
jgi:hypothetical protein